MAFRYLSVCSGIEAATQAWHPLGWQCAGVSEIEPFPRAVLEQRLGAVPVEYDTHRWSEGSNITPLFGDFTKIEAHHVGPIDLLVGGTPCQSFSVAGKRLGLDDPRGNLTLEFLALAQRVRPRWICWENVPGILSHDEGRTFGTFLGLLEQCGFRWAYRVIDAQFARVGRFGRAVPQRRRRVFVIGYSGTGPIHPRAVLFDRESLRGNPAPRREAGQGTACDVAPSLTSSGRGVERAGETRGQDPVVDGHDWPADCAPTLNAAFGDKLGLEDQHIRGGQASLCQPCANPLTARMHKGIKTTLDEGQTLIPTPGGGFDGADVAHSLRGEGFDASEDGTGRGTPIVPVQHPPEVAGTLKACGGKSGLPNGAEECDRMVPVAIQERAVSENPDAGPDGKGWRDDGAAYTLEARSTVQAIAFSAKDHGGVATVECSPTLRSGGHADSHANAGVMPAVAFDMRGREGGAMPEGPHDTANIRAASGGSSRSYVASSWSVRRLTPRECERLQGFPDDFTKIEWRKKPADNCPDGPRYKALGNSMAVNVMAWLGERIAAVDAIGGGE